jgi:hypothetical protein
MTEEQIEEAFENYKEKRWAWVETLPKDECKGWTDFYNTYYRSPESLKDFTNTMKNKA